LEKHEQSKEECKLAGICLGIVVTHFCDQVTANFDTFGSFCVHCSCGFFFGGTSLPPLDFYPQIKDGTLTKMELLQLKATASMINLSTFVPLKKKPQEQCTQKLPKVSKFAVT
jgi:hypothetical protein